MLIIFATVLTAGKSQWLAEPYRRGYRMNNIAGMALLATGIVLLIFGFNESHSFSSDVSRFFTGNPTDRSMWMIIGGIVAIIVGAFIAFAGKRKA